MYTVKKVETPDRGELYAVVIGENVINRFILEDEAKENCTYLNGGEAAEKKLAAAEKKAEEDAKKVAEADAKSRAAAKPKAAAEDNHKPRAHAARAKAHVKRMAPRSLKEARPTRRHK